MASKISLFNAALSEIGHRALVDTGEPVEAGRELNRNYNLVVDDCLAAGSWNFAMETIKSVADTGVTPGFGFTEVFAKPLDWVRTIGISSDENFSLPLLQYYDDAGFWSADVSPIYVRYVSDDTGLGYELTRWPSAFRRYVELELADRSCLRINQSESTKERIAKARDKARKTALTLDALNEPNPKFPPMGSWNSSRGGGFGGDRGNRGSLTG